MTIYSEAWSHTARMTVRKCWKKSQYLGSERITDLDLAIRNLTGSSLVRSTDLADPVSSDLDTMPELDVSEALAIDLFDGFSKFNNVEE